MNSFNLMQVLILRQLNFRTGFLDTHTHISPLSASEGSGEAPGRKLSQNNHRKPPPKEDNFLKIPNFSPHHLQWIAAALLFNKHLVSNGQRRGNEGLRGGVEVCVCVGGDRTTSSLIMLRAPLAAPWQGLSLPLPCSPFLPPGPA